MTFATEPFAVVLAPIWPAFDAPTAFGSVFPLAFVHVPVEVGQDSATMALVGAKVPVICRPLPLPVHAVLDADAVPRALVPLADIPGTISVRVHTMPVLLEATPFALVSRVSLVLEPVGVTVPGVNAGAVWNASPVLPSHHLALINTGAEPDKVCVLSLRQRHRRRGPHFIGSLLWRHRFWARMTAVSRSPQRL